MIYILLIAGVLLLIAGFLLSLRKKPVKKMSNEMDFPSQWKGILLKKVTFYSGLEAEEKKQFEQDINYFLQTTRIIGVETEINIEDKLLVAAGAVIPVFNFPEWTYDNLDEVIIYPGLFNQNFDTTGKGRSVSGMVGSGVMEGKMILSKKSLHLGFDNRTDKKNVAIHEFIHLIDKADGAIDGIPDLLVNKTFALPWLELMRQKIIEIEKSKSDINKYGATSVEEFFPVAAEYFFERPKLLKRKHPKLYNEMDEIFNRRPLEQ